MRDTLRGATGRPRIDDRAVGEARVAWPSFEAPGAGFFGRPEPAPTIEVLTVTKVSRRAKVSRRERYLQARERARERTLKALDACERWVTARELAERTGGNTKSLASHLNALVELGLVQKEVHAVRKPKGAPRTLEHTWVYRSVPREGKVIQLQTPYPAWLAPSAVVPVGERRQVLGRCGLAFSRPDDDEDDEASLTEQEGQ